MEAQYVAQVLRFYALLIGLLVATVTARHKVERLGFYALLIGLLVATRRSL